MNQTVRNVLMIAGLLMLALTACQPVQDTRSSATAERETTLYVGPELVDCVGVGPMQCMLVKENPEDEYTYFYDNIEGFEFEPGYEYELRVLITPRENVPADASSLQYTLIEVVSKEPVAVDAAGIVALEGPTWQLVSVVDAGGALVDVPADVEATATFEAGQVSGSGGCNRFGASYTLEGESVAIMPGPMTMMACPEPRMSVEQAFMAALGVTASYQISGDQLVLLNAEGGTVATFSVQVPASLTGGQWMATAYNNGRDAVVSLLVDTQITALFSEDGQLTGSAGCNNYMAGYRVDGDTIAIEPAATTRKMCAEDVMQQENAYLAALVMAQTFTIQGDTLELRSAEGALIASYILGGE
jgi:heat shock protein HslJ